MRRKFAKLVIACSIPLLAVMPGAAQQKSLDPPAERKAKSETVARISEAERINGIRKLHQADQQRLVELQAALESLQATFNAASERFSRVDAQRSAAQAKLAPDKKGGDTKSVVPPSVETEWLKARDEFNRVIKRRKAIQQQLEILEEKIRLEEAALERVTSTEADAARTEETEAKSTGKLPVDPANTATPASQPSPIVNIALPLGTTATPLASEAPAQKSEKNVVADESVREAHRQQKVSEAALRQAEEQLKLRDQAIEVFERDLTSARELLEIARDDLKAAEAEWRTISSREDEPQSSDEENDSASERQAAQQRLYEARKEVAQQTARVTESERLWEQLKESREEVVDKIEAAQAEVEAAKLRVQFLESPVAPHRLLNWIMRSGPRILIVIVAMFVAWWLSRVMARRIVAAVVRRGFWGHPSEREGRAETLRRVFQSAASVAIFVLGGLALLDQAGINVTVLLGGAAVLGAAIAFGSQNLIRDYFSGFMVLVENQYSVGNVIRVAGVAGVVEDITLRMTVLRDEEGVVHFIPHSQLTTVSNLTHGWSRAVFTVGVGYNENVDRVMQVLMDLAKELKADPQYSSDLLGDAEMLGVDGLSDSAVVIKFLIKTRPLMQWKVKREMLRRIKAKFDVLGIEIPFPQRTLNIRNLELLSQNHDGAVTHPLGRNVR